MQASRGVPGGPGCSSPRKKFFFPMSLFLETAANSPRYAPFFFFETRGGGHFGRRTEKGRMRTSKVRNAGVWKIRPLDSSTGEQTVCIAFLMRLAAWDPKRREGVSNEQPASDLLPGGKVGHAKKKT